MEVEVTQDIDWIYYAGVGLAIVFIVAVVVGITNMLKAGVESALRRGTWLAVVAVVVGIVWLAWPLIAGAAK